MSLLLIRTAYSVDYDSVTVLKDMGTSTPTGDENPRIIDDALRMHARLLHAEHHTLVLTGNGTATTTDTYIIGSSSSGILCSLPLASTVADGTTTKHFVIKNRGAGTMTLSPTVDGVGSPTVSQNGTMVLFTDGTSWFEQRVKNSESAGTATTSTNATLFNSNPPSYYTNADNLSSGTIPLARIPATLTGKDADTLDGQEGSYYTSSTNQSSGTLPLARLPSTLTGKDADTLDTIDSTGFVQVNTTYLKKLIVGATQGTGTVELIAGTGIGITMVDNGGGNGSVTVSGVGTFTSAGWVLSATNTASTEALNVIVNGTLTVSPTYGVSGLLDRDIPNTITLDNLTQVTTRNFSALQGSATASQVPLLQEMSGQLQLGTQTNKTIDTLSITGTATVTNLDLTSLYGSATANVFAWRSSTLSVTTGTWTSIPFNDATATVYNASHTTNSFPEHFKVLVAGKYLAGGVCQIRMANGAAGLRMVINDDVVGTGSVKHGYFNYGDGNTGGELVSNCVLTLAANDNVSLQVCHNSADNPKTILDANWGAAGLPSNAGSTTATLTLTKIGN